MSIHQNSLKAYDEEFRNLSKREVLILRLLIAKNTPLTDRQVMEGLGYTDPNAVRPRLTSLIEKGYVREIGTTTCRVTGKAVRQVWALPRQPKLNMEAGMGAASKPYQHVPAPGGLVTVADGIQRKAVGLAAARNTPFLPGIDS